MARGPVVLGLVDGLHDAGAALVVDGVLVAAANEERFTRRKLQGGMPRRSIAAVLATAGVPAFEVTDVAVGGVATPTFPTRLLRPLQGLYAHSMGLCFTRPWHPVDRLGDLVRYRLGWTRATSHGARGRREGHAARAVLPRQLPAGLRRARLHLVDHHMAHAESAWRTSTGEDTLVVTADAHGDGRSMTLHAGRAGNGLVRRFEAGADVSLGAFYAYVTALLGFAPGRHEGKVLGLAASGDARRIERPFPFRWHAGALTHHGRWGLRGMADLAPLREHAREDVAAWLQAGTEEVIVALVAEHLRASGSCRLALAGGVFANVALNGRLAALDGVESLHVFPHMGDGGLAAGAALHVSDAVPRPLATACLGPDLATDDVRRAAGRARARGLLVERPGDPDAVLAAALQRGLPVVRVAGRLEFGPRALGHRSVLAPARDPRLPDRINEAFHRDRFMPFGPILRREDAATFLQHEERAREATRFMTVALPATPALRHEAPAAVHVDGSARAQVVARDDDAELHRLLTRVAQAGGPRALVNTSFNRHEEPIVHTACEALEAFVDAGLPLLRLGPFLIRRPGTAWEVPA